MTKRNLRFHLRHSGDTKLRFGVSRFSRRWNDKENWGINFALGRWYLVVRDRNLDPSHYKPNRFFDLGMGRAMLHTKRLYDSMTEEEHRAYDDVRSCGPLQGISLEYFLEQFRSGKIKI
jgi:hypothetical protein